MQSESRYRTTARKGGTIIESSSGNTAVSLAIIAAVKGYKFIAVVDHHAQPEKINTIRAYGGKIVYIDSSKYAANQVGVAEREKLAAELSLKTPNSVFLHQAHNEANRDAYINTIATEIAKDVPDANVFFASIGTVCR